jgi:hypothetical protein
VCGCGQRRRNGNFRTLGKVERLASPLSMALWRLRRCEGKDHEEDQRV